jgi:mRNA-degrading endonuclease RelE of RelBE toxin-antitoxin system
MPKQIRERADKQIHMLLQNPQHPSLRLKKMKGYVNQWEISVTMSYRIVFQIIDDMYVLIEIGPHDVIDEE